MDYRENIDYGTDAAIGDVDAVVPFNLALPVTAPDAAVNFEYKYIDDDGFRKSTGSIKTDKIRLRTE